jgi:hypothetical protein
MNHRAKIDHVRTQLVRSTLRATGIGPPDARIRLLRRIPAGRPEDVGVVWRTDIAVIEEMLDIAVMRQAAIGEFHHVLHPCPLGPSQHLRRLIGRQRQRLLAQHMHSGPEARHHHRVVQILRRDNHQRIKPAGFHHRPIVGFSSYPRRGSVTSSSSGICPNIGPSSLAWPARVHPKQW